MSAEIVTIGRQASRVERASEIGEANRSMRDYSLGLNYVYAVGMMEYAQETLMEAADLIRAAAQNLNWLSTLGAGRHLLPVERTHSLHGR